MASPHPPEICPNCGAAVPPESTACPECGSDHDTGWSDEARISGLDLPDESFNYDRFVEKEFGPEESTPAGLSRFWWLIAVLVLGAVIFLFAG